MFTITSTRSVTLAKRGSGYLNMKLNLIGAGHLWGTIAGAIASQAVMATAQDSVHSGNSFNNLYLLFEFKDSSLPSDPLRYGWVNLSLANGNLSTLFDYPSLAIGGWAYDTTGAQIRSGAVPEPGSMSFLALGALALGARGLRSWRRNRRGE